MVMAMARNLGRIRLEKVAAANGQAYSVPYVAGGDELWNDYAQQTPGCIYLVVDDSGSIVGAGPDPAWNLIEGYDIWEVEGDDWKGAVFKHWNGTEVVE